MKTEVLDSHKSQQLIGKFINTPKSQIIHSIKELTLKAPLVLKIISPDAIHKTEIGGVSIVHHDSEVEKEFDNLILIARKNRLSLKGILAQEFIEGTQLIIGLKKDPTFNHVILFGLGGIFTELLNDISIRKCPISKEEAQDMINELKSKKLFQGFRNIQLNINVLKESLVAVSKIPQKHKNIKELDINPFILNSKEGKAVDARVVLEK